MVCLKNWENEIVTLGKDFCINDDIVAGIINDTTNRYMQVKTPKMYKGDRKKFLYAQAHRKLKTYILTSLEKLA